MQRRARTAAMIAGLLLGAAAYVSAVQFDDAPSGDAAVEIAEAFDSENVTEFRTSLQSEKLAPPSAETRDLRPIQVFTTKHYTEDLLISLPYGGALVALEATALLVAGATIVVLVIAKVKSRSTMNYSEDHMDPMLQSLLYSDMDYAAI